MSRHRKMLVATMAYGTIVALLAMAGSSMVALFAVAGGAVIGIGWAVWVNVE